jgi:predicted nucleotidyltransferase
MWRRCEVFGFGAAMLKESFDEVVNQMVCAIRTVYGDRLISVVLYGSVARGTMRHDSDMDVLIVAEGLPNGRMNRIQEFEAVEEMLVESFQRAASRGVTTSLSPVLKSADELQAGSPLFLDMVEDARVLYDRDGDFKRRIDQLRRRLTQLGAKRIWKGNAWYWDLKPDYQPGEVFEL